MGAWATLTLASRLSVSDIHVLGDSKIVIDWLNRKGTLHVATLDGWKDRITELLTLFRSISCAHIYREENQEADRLSKRALNNCPGRIAYNHWEGGHEGPTLFLNMF
jgi:ribonuclease HI